MRRRLLAAALCTVVYGSYGVADALQLVECPEVNFLAPACHEVSREQEPSQGLSTPEPPLFTLQTMRPDTPPLLLKVFNDPSDANIAAYKAWQHRYLSRMLEVEQRLKAYDAQQRQGKGR